MSRTVKHLRFNLLILLTFTASLGSAQVDFNRDIRPLLSDRCFACHGPDAKVRKANLRLYMREELFKKRGDLHIVVPGAPEQSELYRRITATDPAEQMPRPDFKRSLSEAEIALIEQWIEEGAEYKTHWAFDPIKDVPVPTVKNSSWPKDPLDHFVLARLESDEIGVAPEASREKLIRRLSFDLTGLPPTIEEIDAFLADETPQAYENLVDRLLASPRFGERMATDWLDLARFADTYGYQSDVHRDMWQWRDWVIKAFNDNLPYDQFITWQLAGDLLPNPTREQRIATAFNRHHRQTNEGGSVEEEYRVEYVADRTHTAGTAFLGLTVECARCHDHKYDPISQKDYYSLFAFFNSIDESGLYSHFTNAVPTPTLLLSDTPTKESVAALKQKVSEAEHKLAQWVVERRDAFNEWRQNPPTTLEIGGKIGDFSFDEIKEKTVVNAANSEKPATLNDNPEVVPGSHGNGLKMSGENNVVFKDIGAFTRATPFSIALWMQIPDYKDRSVIFHRSRAWTDAGSRGYQLLIEDGKLSGSLIHFWPGNAIRIRAKERAPERQWIHVVITYDGSSRADGLKLYLNGELAETDTVRDNLYKNIAGSELHLTIGQRFRDRGFKNGLVDEFKVFERCLTPLEVLQLHDGRTLETALEGQMASDNADDWLYEYYLANADAAYQQQLSELAKVREEYNKAVDAIPELMTMSELPEPRPTYVLKRGSYQARGEQVFPNTPPNILFFPDALPRNRLGLAQWLTHPQNPLTARVAVNRYWQMLFGVGLVSTPEDFGSQGARPTHPELLDWLAQTFIDTGGDGKEMIKRIVMSATYRQSSIPTPALLKADPENRLLGRGPKYRLPAEIVRDNALFVSGLLVQKIGGPSVKPYQPAGLWKEKSGRKYEPDKGEGLYRRSLYTYWKRTSPPPSMMLFDAAKRDVCVAKRQTTNTPMQALVLLNDVQFVEAARAFGERILKSGGETLGGKIRFAFRTATSRHPTEQEFEILKRLYLEQEAIFKDQPEEAEKLLSIGERTRDESLPATETAAATILASTLLNFDETITKR